MNVHPLSPKLATQYIAQVSFSPQAVLDKSATLQNALNWGLGVSSFIISVYMMASIVRYFINSRD